MSAARFGPPPEPLRPVFSAYSPVEAHLVRGMLEDGGVACFLSNEFIAAVDSPVSSATGCVQVLVRAADAERAAELLRGQAASEAASLGQP